MIESCEVYSLNLRYFEDNEEIPKIKKVILNNQILFGPFQEKTFSIGIQDDIGIYIENFDDFFRKHLAEVLMEDSVLSILGEKQLFTEIYIGAMKNICQNKDIFDDISYFLVACKFYNYTKKENLDSLMHSLINHNDENLFLNFLIDTELINSYNYYLKIKVEDVKKENIPYFETKMGIIKYILQELGKAVKEDDLPFVSKEKFNYTFLSFLKRINAPREWYKIFESVKIADNINHPEIKESYYDHLLNEIGICAKGEIGYFLSFVHEFGHCVVRKQKVPAVSLNEFVSIFYEKLAARFLIEIGYNESKVKNIASFRSKNNVKIFMDIHNILLDLYEYSNSGLITKEKKLKRIKAEDKIISMISKYLDYVKEDYSLLDKDITDIAKNIEYEEKSDEHYYGSMRLGLITNMFVFLDDFDNFVEKYIYIINSYMADKLLDKDERKFLDKMVNITDSLYQYDAFTLLHDLGLEDIFQEKRKDVKTHKRKKEE